jgi:hypothetical protein
MALSLLELHYYLTAIKRPTIYRRGSQEPPESIRNRWLRFAPVLVISLEQTIRRSYSDVFKKNKTKLWNCALPKTICSASRRSLIRPPRGDVGVPVTRTHGGNTLLLRELNFDSAFDIFAVSDGSLYARLLLTPKRAETLTLRCHAASGT